MPRTPRGRPNHSSNEHGRRIQQYNAHQNAFRAIGGFPGRGKVNERLLLRQATIPGAIEYLSGKKSAIAQNYYAAVLDAFNGNEEVASQYLAALRKNILGK